MDTNVIDAPAISEAMTAAEMDAHCIALRHLVGPASNVSFILSRHQHDKNICATVMISPIGYSNTQHFNGSSWPEATRKAYEWARSRPAIRRETVIRRMALAVIDLTDSGQCTAQMLRARDFSQAEIEEFHEAACVRAGEMCASDRFVVVMDGAVS